jgi:paraquat-inducible protein B
MSRKANPAVVGGFVLGAIVLAVAGVFFFGGGKFFKTTETYVSYFEGSLKGLEVGAPVTFRGVRVGSVQDIKVVYQLKNNNLKIPVIFEIDLDRLEVVGKGGAAPETRTEAKKEDSDLVKRGLRAQLQMRSLVTGQLAVNLDFFPDSKIVRHEDYKGLPEFPTVPSEVEKFRDVAQKLIASVQDARIDEIAGDLRNLLKSMRALVTSKELEDAIKGADRLINSPDLQALARDLRAALESAEKAMNSVRQLAENADGSLAPLEEGLRRASGELDKLLDEATRILASVESSLSDDSDLRVRAVAAMEEVAEAARSVRVLANYIERHPEAFLKGKKETGQ